MQFAVGSAELAVSAGRRPKVLGSDKLVECETHLWN